MSAAKRDRGAVLINALVVVLAISAVSVAMLTRSEEARVQAALNRDADQLALYLDGAERLVPGLLAPVVSNSVAHPGQSWAQGPHVFPIDRGQVRVTLADMQGRLNVNWLGGEDDHAREVFRAAFTELGLAPSRVAEIAAFVGPAGPPTAPYLARRPAMLPRGGPIAAVEDLRALAGLSPAEFAALRPYLAAMPWDLKLNLNTASPEVKRAALAHMPSELVTEILNLEDPIRELAPLRLRAQQILGDETAADALFDRLTFSSNWFRATLTAELDGQQQTRVAIYRIDISQDPPVQRMQRWAAHD